MSTIDIADEFAERSRQFLDVIAHAGRGEDSLLRLLAGLYAAALDLPAVEPGDESLVDSTTTLPPALDGLGLYSTTVDPLEPASALACGDLNDDLRDIARDLGEGLALFDRGATASAVWHWRFTFESHWGRHVVEAIRVLHQAAVKRRSTA